MTKQVNPNIGHMDCPICHETAAVRRNVGHKLYFDCMHCGRIYPNHSGGQRFILETATLWPEGKPPADVPDWIAQQWPYVKALRHRDHVETDLTAANDDSAEPDKMSGQPLATTPGDLLPPPPKSAPVVNTDPAPEQRRGFAFMD